jgi:hypothetical protein
VRASLARACHSPGGPHTHQVRARLEAAWHPCRYYRAEDKGYVSQEKLAVTIDQRAAYSRCLTPGWPGPTRPASATSTLIIQNAVAKPGMAPVMLYMIHNREPLR